MVRVGFRLWFRLRGDRISIRIRVRFRARDPSIYVEWGVTFDIVLHL